MVIDVQTHLIPPGYIDFLRGVAPRSDRSGEIAGRLGAAGGALR